MDIIFTKSALPPDAWAVPMIDVPPQYFSTSVDTGNSKAKLEKISSFLSGNRRSTLIFQFVQAYFRTFHDIISFSIREGLLARLNSGRQKRHLQFSDAPPAEQEASRKPP